MILSVVVLVAVTLATYQPTAVWSGTVTIK